MFLPAGPCPVSRGGRKGPAGTLDSRPSGAVSVGAGRRREVRSPQRVRIEPALIVVVRVAHDEAPLVVPLLVPPLFQGAVVELGADPDDGAHGLRVVVVGEDARREWGGLGRRLGGAASAEKRRRGLLQSRVGRWRLVAAGP